MFFFIFKASSKEEICKVMVKVYFHTLYFIYNISNSEYKDYFLPTYTTIFFLY